MPQGIENWATLFGHVTGVRPSIERTNWVVVELVVDTVEEVEGYRNLLGSQIGPTTLEMPTRAADAAGVERGVLLRCRAARRTERLIVAHPDHLQVLPNARR